MSKLSILTMAFFSLLTFCSFTTLVNNDLKIIRFMRTESGFVVSEYTNGTIKKQISNKRITSFDLSKKEVEEIQKEIESLNFHHLVNEINQQEEFSQYPAVMYMYIRGNDTIKTNFFKASSIPSHAKKLDLLMTKMRSNS